MLDNPTSIPTFDTAKELAEWCCGDPGERPRLIAMIEACPPTSFIHYHSVALYVSDYVTVMPAKSPPEGKNRK